MAFRYDVGVENVTAFVLAGGRSSRMGSDKALLPFGNRSLLQRALETAVAVAGRTCIAGSASRYAEFGEVVEDVYPGCGPLGGIHAALSASRTDLNLILSVDMPRLDAKFLAWLVKQAAAAQELIVVPYALGGLQPLCAVYRRAVARAAEQALNCGQYKISCLFAAVPTRTITEAEMIAERFSPALFTNVNTLQDYEYLMGNELAVLHCQKEHNRS